MANKRPADVRAALLEAAIRHLERHDLNDLSLRQLARTVGVSPGAPYKHFPTRQALVDQLVLDGFQSLAARLRSGLVRAQMRGSSELDACGQEYVTFALEQPWLFRMMFSGAGAGPLLRRSEAEAFDVLVEAVRHEQKKGGMPPGDPRHVALNPWSTAHGCASLLVSGQFERRGFGKDELPLVMRIVFRAPDEV